MKRHVIYLQEHPGEYILLPDGMFKLANPDQIRLRAAHLIECEPMTGRPARIVAVDPPPTPLPALPSLADFAARYGGG